MSVCLCVFFLGFVETFFSVHVYLNMAWSCYAWHRTNTVIFYFNEMEVQSTDLSGIKIYMYTNPKKVRISASEAITHSKRQTLRERERAKRLTTARNRNQWEHRAKCNLQKMLAATKPLKTCYELLHFSRFITIIKVESWKENKCTGKSVYPMITWIKRECNFWAL